MLVYHLGADHANEASDARASTRYEDCLSRCWVEQLRRVDEALTSSRRCIIAWHVLTSLILGSLDRACRQMWKENDEDTQQQAMHDRRCPRWGVSALSLQRLGEAWSEDSRGQQTRHRRSSPVVTPFG